MTPKQMLEIKKTKDLLKIITRELGYTESRGNGSSHLVFRKANAPSLSIPNTREIAPGTRRNIVKLIFGEAYYA